MNIVMNLVLALQILTALTMIGLVLIQHGKGADMGASFGSGASGSLFGATGSANFLSRSTAVCAAVFFVCTLSLAYTANDRPRATTGSVLDRPAAASAPAPSASGAAAIPGAVAIVPSSASSASSLQSPAPIVAPVAPAASSGAGAIPQK
ncbi:MAG: preprotein translocase subunit SecG [Caldimonas sp.]